VQSQMVQFNPLALEMSFISSYIPSNTYIFTTCATDTEYVESGSS
jgi:hypothetical protein